ncbi:DUF3298 domain-containing protein [Canicola haemoglobinophilus]|uniref:Protein of uncharacterized function (DUF3298) n=1 Tax=Canicola haemoglobinophilus TaxID=733 RepID=A0A1V4B0Q9_9PAST|nr:RsiV family protein [Canicola haemoglobinophilus]OOS00091.1 DUF3298 domain-containing protein [Canicola haemoglobinophilus]STO60811.1 Protein of uncharacterised function (DUF3298) [Canicola haemoglobinophilus]
MKKILLSLSIAIIALLSACQDQEIKNLQVNTITLFNKEESIVYPASTDELSPKKGIITVRGELSETGIEWLDQLLIKSTYNLIDSQENIKKDNPTKQDLIKKFQQIYDELANQAKESSAFGIAFELESYYTEQYHHIITFMNSLYSFYGGPHPFRNAYYQNIDINKRKVIEVNDIVSQHQQEKLKEILWKDYNHILIQKNIDNYIAKEDFTISKQFYFDDNGITFVYQPYELLPYAYGYTILVVGWEQIQDIINPEYLWKK